MRRAPAVAGLLFALAGSAGAQTVLWDGFNRNDPIGSAVARLADLVRDRCVREERTVVYGISQFDPGTTGLNQDQLVHLRSTIHAALSRTPKVEVSAFADVMATLELESAGMLTRPEHSEVQRRLERVEIRVQPLGTKRGRDFLLSLRALGGRSVTCDVSTDPVPVPPHLTGESFETPDNLFQRAATDLRNRARGRTEVAVSGREAGVPMAAQSLDEFTSRMREAITRTEQRANVQIGNEAVFFVYNALRRPPSQEVRWDAEISLIEQRTGFRLGIDLSNPDSGTIAHSGLVQPDQLPATRVPSQPRAAGGRVASQELRLRPVAVRLAGTVDDRNPSQAFAFDVSSESYVEVDVPVVNGRVAPMPPVVVDSRGQVMQPINPPGSRPNLRRYRLDPGGYRITITNPGRTKHDYVLAARAVTVSEMLVPETPGRLTAQFQDWYVGEMTVNGQRQCYAFTPATAVSPRGWREQLPVIWMGLSSGAGGSLSHYLDLADRYRDGTSFNVSISGPDGGQDLLAAPIGRHVSPVIAGRSGEPVLDREAIRGYTRGAELVLNGSLPDGRSARIVYSLAGYRSAASAMARACGRLDLARDLVWR